MQDMPLTQEQLKQKAVEKIKKIIALSSSSNEHEAKLAWKKAQTLLLEFNLTLDEFSGEEQRKKDIAKDTYFMGSKRALWRSTLLHMIAKNFLCTTVRVVDSNKLYVIGEQHNIDIVKELATSIEKQLELFAEVAYALNGGVAYNKRSWKTAWYEGAMKTLDERFQAITNNNIKALIVVTQEELEQKKKEFFPKIFTGVARVVKNAGAYHQGRQDGHKVTIHKELR